jgi:hypothetical protein
VEEQIAQISAVVSVIWLPYFPLRNATAGQTSEFLQEARKLLHSLVYSRATRLPLELSRVYRA